MKRFSTIALTILLVSGLLLAACGKDTNSQATGESSASSAESSSSSAPVKIKVFAHQNADTDLATNTFTKLAEKKFNIKFEWEAVPTDGAAEKRQIALASGDYADMFLVIPWVDGFTQNDMLRLSKQGVIIPLNDLIDKYAPNIKSAMEQYPYYKAANTAPDGKIYGLSQLNECYHCSYPNKLWMNTSWLKKLNLDVPKTPEEMKKVLEAFKTKDPNGNGKADEVPLSGSTEDFGVRLIPYFMNAFTYDDDKNYLNVNSGKVGLAANTSDWKDGLAYIKSLYEEKLIDLGAFSQNADALYKIGNNASAELLGAATAMHPYIFVGGDNENSKHYDAIPPLQGKVSYAHFSNPYDSTASFVLTNKASEQAQIAAIKLMDYLFTVEGQELSNFGQEGVEWRKPKEGEVGLESSVKPLFAKIPGQSGAKPSNNAWGPISQFFQPKSFRDAIVAGTDSYDPSGYERRLQEATHLYDGKVPPEVFPYWSVWIDPSDADEAAVLTKNIKDYVDQNALQFITGSKSLDKDWDAYLAGLDKLGLKRYLEIMQQAYDGFKKNNS